MTDEVEFNQILSSLKRDYIERLQSQVGKMRDFAALLKQRALELEELKNLERFVHGFSGSGTTFGFPGISMIGSALEKVVTSPKSRPTEILLLLQELLEECESSILSAEGKGAFDLAAIDLKHSKIIAIVGGETELTDTLSRQVKYSGYEPIILSSLTALSLISPMPEIIIIVTEFSSLEYIEIARFRQRNYDKLPALIFLSHDNSFDSRLKAVRLGCEAYFPIPVDPVRLIEKIQQSIGKAVIEPYHILLVENDEILASTFSAILKESGMRTTVVSDPRLVTTAVDLLSVDVILIDFYLPYCNGLELAGVLRQYEMYLSIPIMFISSENQLESLLRDSRLSIDDFLTKPVSPLELAAKVSKRAERGRILRNLMAKDGLTGLLNHVKFKEDLELELERSARRGGKLVYALLDIDNFKSINDNYGHAAGDTAIKSLVSLLKQRLRHSDIIGRYGGDEFALAMLDTEGSAGMAVLDSIRERFASIKHKGESGGFFSSFSCGLACFPEFNNAAVLYEAADKALYEAKRKGRNCLQLAVAGK